MPTVLRIDGYRFFFFSAEGKEPAHVQVEKAEKYAKFWLNPISLARSGGFRGSEIAEIFRIAQANQNFFLEKWNEYFSTE